MDIATNVPTVLVRCQVGSALQIEYPSPLGAIHAAARGSATVTVVSRQGRAPTRGAPTNVNFHAIRKVLRLSLSYNGRETLVHLSTAFTHVQPSHRRGNPCGCPGFRCGDHCVRDGRAPTRGAPTIVLMPYIGLGIAINMTNTMNR